MHNTYDKDANSLLKQIPKAGIPSGVAVPGVAALVLIVLISSLGWLRLADRPHDVVPKAVIDTQQELTVDLANAFTASAKDAVAALDTAASVRQPTRPDEILQQIMRSHSRWQGAGLLDPVSGRFVASAGAPLPLSTDSLRHVTKPTLFPTRAAGEAVELVAAVPVNAPVSGSMVLTASTSVRLPTLAEGGAHSKTVMLAANGTVLAGGLDSGYDAQHYARVVNDARRSDQDNPGSVVEDPLPQSPVDLAQQRRRSPVVTYAPVLADGASDSHGLAMAVVSKPEMLTAKTDDSGLLLALSLCAVGVAGFLVTWFTLVRPVRRMRAEAVRMAAGDLSTPPTQAGVREAARVTRVLEQCRARLRGESPASGSSRLPRLTATVGVLLSTVLLLAWAGTVAFLPNREVERVPNQLLADAGDRIQRTADSVRASLNRGVRDLESIAVLTRRSGPDATISPLQRLVENSNRYRSAYVLDSDGGIVRSAGESPLLRTGHAPTGVGVRQGNTSGRIPLVYAHVPLGDDGKHTLVAEFDVLHLGALADGGLGRTRVVDEGMRVIADTEGYLAFEALPGTPARQVAREAGNGMPAERLHGIGSDANLLTAAQVQGSGPAGGLKWTVVDSKPVSEFTLPTTMQHRNELAVALLVAFVAIVCGGWQYFVLVMPLRRLGDRAEAMVADPTETVLHAERHDEVGTVTRCLEICRQAIVEGQHRLGGVRVDRRGEQDSAPRDSEGEATPESSDITEKAGR